MRIPLISLLVTAALALLAPAAAGAHVEMQPRQAIGGDTVGYTLIAYPHTQGRLLSITASIPSQLDVTAAAAGDGATAKLARTDGRVTSIAWTGPFGSLDPSVGFTAKTGLRQATLVVPTVLRFADGSSERWLTARTTVLGYTDLRPKRAAAAANGSRNLLPWAAAAVALAVLATAAAVQLRSRR